MNAVPFLYPGELQRLGLLSRAPGRPIPEQIAWRADSGRRFAEIDSCTGDPMRPPLHAVGNRGGKSEAGLESEPKVEPPVTAPEQNGGGPPARLPEPVAVEVREIRAIAAEEEQCPGVCRGVLRR